MAENQSENAIIAQEMKALLTSEESDLFANGMPRMLAVDMPSGRTLRTLKTLQDEYRLFPERRKGTVRITAIDSLIEIVERFKNPDSVIFADTTQASPRLLAVFDYHPQGGVGGIVPSELPEAPEPAKALSANALAKIGADPSVSAAIQWPVQLPLENSARWGEHRALYEFPKSDEWNRWKGKNEVWMPQEEFALFIEDNVLGVGAPESAKAKATEIADVLGMKYATAQKLMTLSRGLKITASIQHEQTIDLQSGEASMLFKEEHTDGDGQKVSVPGGFLVNIPIFTGSAPWQLVARLQYKRQGKAIVWRYSLYRTDQFFEAAILDEAQRVKNKTGLPVLQGKPGGKPQDD